MYNVNDYIMYGQKGVCRIGDITNIKNPQTGEEREYYVIYPINDINSKIYFPTSGSTSSIRPAMNRDDAQKLIDSLTSLPVFDDENSKMLEQQYKNALNDSDCRQAARIIKTVYIHRKEREAVGKKLTSTDARYLKMAEQKLYGELAFALGKKISEMEEYIILCIDKCNNQDYIMLNDKDKCKEGK